MNNEENNEAVATEEVTETTEEVAVATEEETTEAVATKPTKTVAILARTKPLASAIAKHLGARMAGASFVNITRMGDLPTDAGEVILAGIGLPNRIPGNEKRSVISLNTQYHDNDQERKAQWEMVNGEDSDVEEIGKALSGQDCYTVIPAGAAGDAKHEYADVSMAYMDEGDYSVEAQLALAKEQLRIIKSVSSFK